ncbi:MAG: hypothetical protein RL660_1848 [Bacteroidota bacterium]|jgi:hypothetical protein
MRKYNNLVLSLFAACMLLSTACKKKSVATTCDILPTTSHFMTAFNSVAASPLRTMDLQVKEYQFTTTDSAHICAIGYEGEPGLNGGAASYNIEILNGATVLATVTSDFPSGAKSYQSITPVTITPGNTYTIRRTVLSNLGNVVNTICKTHLNPTFPITSGPIKIIGGKSYEVYSAAAPYNVRINGELPEIDFAFTN